MRKIHFDKKAILIIIVIILLILYYFFYKKSNVYQEFEASSNLKELISYEEEIKEEQEKVEVQEENTEDKSINERGKILVHITGEVKSAGVVELEEGTRIIDAVNKAGGFTEQADTEKVNLAYTLSDGIKIYIPSKNEEDNKKEYITTASGDNVITEESKMEKTNNTLININKASQTELETLPGIGPSIALKIISYREENGSFSSIEDIKNVSGIGDNKFENIKDFICV